MQTVIVQQVDHGHQRCGLSGARPAGDEGDSRGKGQADGLPLLVRVFQALPGFQFFQVLFQVGRRLQRHLLQPADRPGYISLLLPDLLQIDCVPPPHRLPDHLFPVLQSLQVGIQGLFLPVQQPGGGGHQLVLRQKGVTCLKVEGQYIQKPRLQPQVGIRCNAHLRRQLVRPAEIQQVRLLAQQIGVLCHHFRGAVAVGGDEAGGKIGGQAVLNQKFQQQPGGVETQELRLDLPCLFQGDAADLRQAVGHLRQHVKALHAEAVHNELGGFGTDALHRAGGQIGVNARLIGGHLPQVVLHLELGPVLGVHRIGAGSGNVLARSQKGHGAHNGDGPAIVQLHPGHGIAVFVVFIDDVLHDPFQGVGLFFHGRTPPLQSALSLRGTGSAHRRRS